ncbi:MAG: FixH family protein [Saprospiraceae bacterium]|nr:FixH family protein [Saprospiraceae bacterium]
MSWGYKIVCVYSVFVLMIGYFLYVAFQQNNELIEDHYYEKELQYQSVITGSQNLYALDQSLNILVLDQKIQLNLPSSSFSVDTWVQIEFLKLSNEQKDVRLKVQPDSTGTIHIDRSLLSIGIYQLRLKWTHQGVPYVYRDEFKYLAT